jgi:hypothetical protein
MGEQIILKWILMKKGMDCINLARPRDQEYVLVNMVVLGIS